MVSTPPSTLQQLRVFKTDSKPETWARNSIYFVASQTRAGVVDIYVTGADEVPVLKRALNESDMAELLAAVRVDTVSAEPGNVIRADDMGRFFYGGPEWASTNW